jgi:Fur family ferric uptake transcriptional regulator
MTVLPSEHAHAAPPPEALRALRSQGRRLTRQRVLIWDTLVESRDRHLSAADVADAVHARDPELHQATIYRTLETFVDGGLLLRTDLGADRSYYELPAEHRHHHVVCTGCGAVAHIHHEDVEEIVGRVQTASGYALDETDLAFSGRCPDCATD